MYHIAKVSIQPIYCYTIQNPSHCVMNLCHPHNTLCLYMIYWWLKLTPTKQRDNTVTGPAALNQFTSNIYPQVRQRKKSWFLSAPSSNFYNYIKKRAMLLIKYLSLAKQVKCMHFSGDMEFSLTLVIFQFFFWWEPRHLFFNFKKIK